MKKMFALLLSAAMLVTLLAACGAKGGETPAPDATKEPAAATEKEEVYVGIVPVHLEENFLIDMVDGFTNQAETYDDVKHTVLDPQKDVEKQMANVDQLISQNADVIVLQPFDAEALKPSVKKCNDAGIPLIELNTRTNDDGEGYIYVGSLDYDAGAMQAEYLNEVMPENPEICVMFVPIGTSTQIERHRGLVENFIEARTDVTVLAEQDGNANRADAMSVAEDWLQKFDHIDAIVCQNDEMAMGVLQAVKAAGRLEEIKILGVDGTPDALKAIQGGELAMTAFQDGKTQGKTAMEVAYKLANGEEVTEDIIIPFAVVTSENVGDYLA